MKKLILLTLATIGLSACSASEPSELVDYNFILKELPYGDLYSFTEDPINIWYYDYDEPSISGFSVKGKYEDYTIKYYAFLDGSIECISDIHGYDSETCENTLNNIKEVASTIDSEDSINSVINIYEKEVGFKLT